MKRSLQSNRILQLIPFNHLFDCVSSGKFLFFDERSHSYFQCTSLEGHTEISVTDIERNYTTQFTIQGSSKIYCIRINDQYKYSLIHRSASYAEIVKICYNKPSQILCYNCKDNSYIRSSIFLQNDYFAIFEPKTIKFFKIDSANYNFSVYKTIKIDSSWNQTLKVESFDFFVTGDNSETLKLFFVKYENQFQITTGQFTIKESGDDLTAKNLIPIYVYKRVYLSYINPRTKSVYLYRVSESLQVTLRYILENDSMSLKVTMGVIDNAIACHDHENRMSLIYDISSPELKRGIKVSKCFHLFNDVSDATVLSSRSSESDNESLEMFDPNLVFQGSDLVFDSLNGVVYKIYFNLENVAIAFKFSSLDLLNFYCHRTDAKYPLFAYLSSLICSKRFGDYSLSSIFNYLARHHPSNEKTMSRHALFHHEESVTFTIEQHNVHANVFFPLLNYGSSLTSDQLCLHLNYCESVIFSYIISLSSHNIMVEHFVCECLVDVMLKQGKVDQLDQMLEFMTPSREFAEYLMSILKNYPSLTSNVANICCVANCLDQVFTLVTQLGFPDLDNKFILSLSNLQLINDNGEGVNILKELKIHEHFPLDFYQRSSKKIETEIITNLLKTLSLQKVLEKSK